MGRESAHGRCGGGAERRTGKRSYEVDEEQEQMGLFVFKTSINATINK